jgi:glucose-6-phosphate 1-epimerase
MSPSARIEELNARFSKQGRIAFETGPGGVVVARLESGGASCRVSLIGATVLSYLPEGGGEVLFLSRRSSFQPGKAIRGGIPLCLPWFGDDPTGSGLPKHGFFRLFEWEVGGTSFQDGDSSVLLTLADSPATREYWPRSFRAECRVSLGDALEVSVRLTNEGTEAFGLSCAFHPYFAISNIGKIELPGLDGEEYQDRLEASAAESRKVQSGSMRFSGEVDRIYARSQPVDIVDEGAGRKVRVAGSGTTKTVVWNPWKEKCAAMADLEAGDYLRYVCVEPGSIAPPEVRVEPGATFEAGMSIEVRS